MKNSVGLPALNAGQFDQFFKELHGYCPFPWQSMLSARCCQDGRWPDVIDLPTASGKTACIDVAIFLLAIQAELSPEERTAPRRIWFVVDRRIVVDEAYDRAKRIAQKLHGNITSDVLRAVAERLKHIGGTALPLAVGRLRGGTPKQLAWSYHPAQPAVITSTVDQIGSRLLFRGYGVGPNSRSIHAALAGNDSLIVLDEAHTANAFRQTLTRISEFRRSERDGERCANSPFGVVTMSATPVKDEDHKLVVFPPAAERKAALSHTELQARFGAEKPAELVEVGQATAESDPLVEEAAARAAKLAAAHRRVVVMVNRVATASKIKRRIDQAHAGLFDVVLLTGRMRPIDRDDLIGMYSPYLRANKPIELSDGRSIILVSTQCLEVGADFSFDALISECASLDALRQRFGRLNRLGKTIGSSPACILIRADDAKAEEKLDDSKPLDPVYGNAMAHTWNWLNSNADKTARGSGLKRAAPVIDMGIDAIGARLKDTDLTLFCAPAPRAPVLLPTYFDLWSQTSQPLAVEPDISLFLHGPQRGAPDAFVVFRDDIPFNDRELACETLELMPPATGERLAVPLWRLKKWLADDNRIDSSDVESEDVESGKTESSKKDFLRFRGRSDIEANPLLEELSPGDTIVLRVEQWPDELGTRWPDNAIDIYERAYETAHARKITRVRQDKPAYGMSEDQRAAVLKLIEKNEEEVPSLAELKQIHPDVSKRAMYPDQRGLVIVLGPSDRNEEELDPYAFDNESLLEGDGIGGKRNKAALKAHTDCVVMWSSRFSAKIFGSATADAIQIAAALHDAGKCDPRFQLCLNNGRRFGPGELMAKSQVFIPQARWKSLRSLAGLPKNFRHEALSMQIAAKSIAKDNSYHDLILHLVISHHGLARPFLPVSVDQPSCDVIFDDGINGCIEISAAERTDKPLHRIDSGVAERFWTLTRTHGWWGLALLESALRLADWQASKENEEGSK